MMVGAGMPVATVARSVLLGGLTVAACGPLTPPPEISGPCTLDVAYQRGEEAARRPLAWPISLRLDPDPDQDYTFYFRGTGWQTVSVTIVDPNGDVATFDDIEAHAGPFFAV
jgi:hypothetical protein